MTIELARSAPSNDEPTDEALVERVRAGDVALFELLVRRHNQRLYRTARSIVCDDREAEDVVQDAYVAAFVHLASFEGRSRFATWLTRITVRQALARSRRRSEVLVDTPMEGAMTEHRHTPEGRSADRELGRFLEAAIDELPPDFRTVFMLRSVQDLSTAETAACLEIPEDTVKTRLHRARRLLQEQLTASLDRATTQVHAFLGDRCDRITAAVMGRIREVG
jgi:RNA polymerase sigma-70 factor (ECF subfamily)